MLLFFLSSPRSPEALSKHTTEVLSAWALAVKGRWHTDDLGFVGK